VLVDIDKRRAHGVASDLSHGEQLCCPNPIIEVDMPILQIVSWLRSRQESTKKPERQTKSST
jgi:hypothetical protein